MHNPEAISSNGGLLVYFNVDGRIQDAFAKINDNGGTPPGSITSIGPPGFRALAKDSEGNRIALHSNTDE